MARARAAAVAPGRRGRAGGRLRAGLGLRARRGRRTAAALTAFAAALALAACSPTGPDDRTVRSFDLTAGNQGWTASFADYSPDDVGQLELVSGRRPLPSELQAGGRALYLAGTNVSDDLFMFIKRELDGLEPGASYEVGFRVRFASMAPSGCAGVGGAPGEAVTVKAGATAVEPRVVASGGDGTYLTLNVDKGNQAEGGPDAVVLGDIATSVTDCEAPEWRLKTLQSESALRVTADSAGAVWLLVGTDSGFEGRTELYYLLVDATLDPV